MWVIKMYLCRDCYCSFDEPDKASDYVPYGEGYADLKYCICPNCGSAEITEAAECEECGEAFPLDELTEGFCPDCLNEKEGAA